jgi:hypothetical protein
MIAKPKLCTGGCQLLKIIWKNHEGLRYCKTCWAQQKPYTINTKKTKKPIVLTPIKNVSQKQMNMLVIYRIRRDQYFKLHPVCEFPGCTCTELDLHHKKGRTGNLLIDDRYFCSLCRPHHQWVEDHPAEAQLMGLSLKRLTK